MLKSQAGPAEQSFLFSREEVSSLRYVPSPGLPPPRCRLHKSPPILAAHGPAAPFGLCSAAFLGWC